MAARTRSSDRVIRSSPDDPITVVGSVERYIEELRERDPALADGPEAALALALAREIDAPNSATSKSMNAHQLRDTMTRLRELCPPERVRDELDELRDRHARGRTEAADRPRAGVREKPGS